MKRVQIVGHIESAAALFLGRERELDVVYDTGNLRVHDGVLVGGHLHLSRTNGDARWLQISTASAVLGLGTMALQNSSNVSISGGAITGIIDLAVTDGGTGQSSFLAGQILVGNGTAGLDLVTTGLLGQLLQSQGAGVKPIWTTISGAGTVVQITLGYGLTGTSNPITVSGNVGIDLTTTADLSTVQTFTNKVLTGNIADTLKHSGTAGNTLTFPNATDTVVLLAEPQSLSGKTLTLPIMDSFKHSGTSGGTFTVPNVASDTLALLAATQSFSNKIYVAPVLTGTGTAEKMTFSKTVAATPVALTDGATITPDFSTGNNFTLTLGGNRSLAAPTNGTAGQSGTMKILQDSTGGRTMSINSVYKIAGGSAPSLTTTANAQDSFDYLYWDSTHIDYNIRKDVK